MYKLLIFGGTTEGRRLAEFCEKSEITADVSVVTDYGAGLITDTEYVSVKIGRLNENQIYNIIKSEKYSCVIDATHPYATEATGNIKSACSALNTAYYRLLRNTASIDYGYTFNDIDSLINHLNTTDKIILSTLGSKEIPKLKAIKNYSERLWVRVLPTENIINFCTSCGIDSEKIIMEKGPFSEEKNLAHIALSHAEILVTKESGNIGGYPQKLDAAKKTSIELDTLLRPKENGFSFEEIIRIIEKEVKS